MTWYEKIYGVPPPVRKKQENKLVQLFQEERKKEKEAAWYKAQEDYMNRLRKNEQS
jgi:hypothetical protein